MTDKMKIAVNFFWNDEAILHLSQRFCHALEDRLQGKPSSLSSLNSHMPLPTGNENGVFLALDFGGTNVRVSRIRLMGKRCYVIEKKISRPLQLPGEYDYLSETTTKEALFDFLARCIDEVALPNVSYKLGHTFSFAAKQQGPHDATFISWSKGMTIRGMEGLLINDLLRQALLRNNLPDVEPVVLVNDTTATLLAAAYQQQDTRIAAICGTGFNMCYYEPSLGTIINLEAGDFSDVAGTEWDQAVDAASVKPGDHLFEKLIGGRYLGEILYYCAKDYYGTDIGRPCTAEDMNRFISLDDTKSGQLFLGKLWKRIVTEQDVRALRTIASSIFVRSAQLSGAACAGVLKHLYPAGDIPEQKVAFEGSIVEKVVGNLTILGNSLRLCFAVDDEGWIRPVPVHTVAVQDGASVGAAVAAAMSEKL